VADRYQLRITNAAGDDPAHGKELLRLDLYPCGMEDIYKDATLMQLAKEGIFARRVEDKRVLTNIGASAEVHDVLIFLAGAGSAAFTGEIAKRLASMLTELGRKLAGYDPEIGDSEALSVATLRHREINEYSQLIGMARNEVGNRVFRFADSVTIEIDRYGNAVVVTTPEILSVADHVKTAGDN
jgi:hypothetical protein